MSKRGPFSSDTLTPAPGFCLQMLPANALAGEAVAGMPRKSILNLAAKSTGTRTSLPVAVCTGVLLCILTSKRPSELCYGRTYIHSHVHTYKRVRVHTNRHTDRQTHRQTDRQTYVHACIRAFVRTYVTVRTYMHPCIRAFVHPCKHVFIRSSDAIFKVQHLGTMLPASAMVGDYDVSTACLRFL